jgi:hypothetical protein
MLGFLQFICVFLFGVGSTLAIVASCVSNKVIKKENNSGIKRRRNNEQ